MKKSSVSPGKAHYFQNSNEIVESGPDSLYAYKVHIGPSDFQLESGDCAYVLDKENLKASLLRGSQKVKSKTFAVVIRGYAPQEKTCSLKGGTYLPYINGCTSRQIFPPERPGDPTWQMLHIPKNTSEQAHHVHSTPRVVYVLSGSGHSIVGTPSSHKRTALKPGMVCLLDSLCAHHFETTNSELVVIPVHIWSTVANAEFNHPMFHGTFVVE